VSSTNKASTYGIHAELMKSVNFVCTLMRILLLLSYQPT